MSFKNPDRLKKKKNAAKKVYTKATTENKKVLVKGKKPKKTIEN